MNPALLAVILQALPSVITGATHLVNYVREVRAVAQQNEEWTPEQEEQFLAALKAHSIDPAYLPDLPLHQSTVNPNQAGSTPHPSPLPDRRGEGEGA